MHRDCSRRLTEDGDAGGVTTKRLDTVPHPLQSHYLILNKIDFSNIINIQHAFSPYNTLLATLVPCWPGCGQRLLHMVNGQWSMVICLTKLDLSQTIQKTKPKWRSPMEVCPNPCPDKGGYWTPAWCLAETNLGPC